MTYREYEEKALSFTDRAEAASTRGHFQEAKSLTAIAGVYATLALAAQIHGG